MFPLKQSVADKLPVKLLDTNGNPVTGVTAPTITLSKNGGALAAVSDGTWTELAGGLYVIDVDATDTNTVGSLVARVTGTGFVDAAVLSWIRANTEADIFARIGAPVGASISADIAAIIAGVWTRVFSTAGGSTLTGEKLLRLLDATQGGKVSGVGTGTVTIRNSEDTKDVIVATVDSQGNRLSIVLNLT